MSYERVYILDFGTQYAQLIARRIREHQCYCEIVPCTVDVERLKGAHGIILSGGPASVYEEGAPRCDPKVFELGIPVLGICYGMQFMCHTLGGPADQCQNRVRATSPAEAAATRILRVRNSASSAVRHRR